MQLQGAGVSVMPYRSLSHAVASIVRADGWRGLYRGYRATVVRDVPFSAIQFTVYETLRTLLFPDASTLGSRLACEFVAGGLAGGIAGALTTPLDLVKTHLQRRKSPFTSIAHGFGTILRHEGPKGLFRGWIPRVIWTIPQSAWMFFVFERLLALQQAYR